MTARDNADGRPDHLRALRLLGDRMLQRVAWPIAERQGWPDTVMAEYLAPTRLQADAFGTLDAALAQVAGDVVPVVGVDALLGGGA